MTTDVKVKILDYDEQPIGPDCRIVILLAREGKWECFTDENSVAVFRDIPDALSSSALKGHYFMVYIDDVYSGSINMPPCNYKGENLTFVAQDPAHVKPVSHKKV